MEAKKVAYMKLRRAQMRRRRGQYKVKRKEAKLAVMGEDDRVLTLV